ncbi:MAG: HEAT repeat domain-containing protein, partial [Candidatus Omnitrophota bacterium]
MDVRKHKAFLKVVSLVVIVAFLAFDIAWAYPSAPSGEYKLSGQSIFQPKLMNPDDPLAMKYKETILYDSEAANAVFNIAKFLWGDSDEGWNPVSLNYMQRVLTNELGDNPAGIILKQVRPKGPIPENGMISPDEVLLIPVVRGDTKLIIQVAQKDKVPEAKLIGYDWIISEISDKYVAKIVPEGYVEEPAEVEPAKTEEAPKIEISEPIAELEAEIKTQPTEEAPTSRRKFIIRAIVASVVLLLALAPSSFGAGFPIIGPAALSPLAENILVFILISIVVGAPLLYYALRAWGYIAPRVREYIAKSETVPLRNLRNDDCVIRRDAVEKLGRPEYYNNTKVIDALIIALDNDADPGVRSIAARSLGKIKNRRALDAIEGAMDDGYESVQEAARWALGQLEDADEIEPAQPSREPSPPILVSIVLAGLLFSSSAQAGTGVLAEGLYYSDLTTWQRILTVLFIPILAAALFLLGLWYINRPLIFKSRYYLKELSRNESTSERAEAAEKLLRLNNKKLLRKKLGKDYELVLSSYILINEGKWDEVIKMGDLAIPALSNLIKLADPKGRTKEKLVRKAIETLAEISSDKAYEVLDGVLFDSRFERGMDSFIIDSVVEKSSSIRPEILIKALRSPVVHRETKKRAAEALDSMSGRFKSSEISGILNELVMNEIRRKISDPESNLRKHYEQVEIDYLREQNKPAGFILPDSSDQSRLLARLRQKIKTFSDLDKVEDILDKVLKIKHRVLGSVTVKKNVGHNEWVWKTAPIKNWANDAGENYEAEEFVIDIYAGTVIEQREYRMEIDFEKLAKITGKAQPKTEEPEDEDDDGSDIPPKGPFLKGLIPFILGGLFFSTFAIAQTALGATSSLDAGWHVYVRVGTIIAIFILLVGIGIYGFSIIKGEKYKDEKFNIRELLAKVGWFLTRRYMEEEIGETPAEVESKAFSPIHMFGLLIVSLFSAILTGFLLLPFVLFDFFTAIFIKTPIAIFKKLGSIGRRSPADRYIKRLGKGDGKAAREKLKEIGEPAVEPLISALGNENHLIRKGVSDVLADIRGERVIKLLIKVMEDDRSELLARSNARRILAKIGDKKAFLPVIRSLNKGIPDDANAFDYDFIKKYANSEVVDELIGKLSETYERMGTRAAIYIMEILGQIGDKRPTKSLLAFLEGEEWYVCRTAAQTLLKTGDEDILREKFGDSYKDTLKAFDVIKMGVDSRIWTDQLIEIGEPAAPAIIAMVRCTESGTFFVVNPVTLGPVPVKYPGSLGSEYTAFAARLLCDILGEDVADEILDPIVRGKRDRLYRSLLLKRKDDSNAFKARDAYRAAVVTADLFMLSFAVMAALYIMRGGTISFLIGVAAAFYLGWATIRYFSIGNATTAETAKYIRGRFIGVTEGDVIVRAGQMMAEASLPQKERDEIYRFMEKNRGKDNFREILATYLAGKFPVAKSDGYRHPVFEDLPQRTQKLINIHEAFKSHFWGMVKMLPVISLFNLRDRELTQGEVEKLVRGRLSGSLFGESEDCSREVLISEEDIGPIAQRIRSISKRKKDVWTLVYRLIVKEQTVEPGYEYHHGPPIDRAGDTYYGRTLVEKGVETVFFDHLTLKDPFQFRDKREKGEAQIYSKLYHSVVDEGRLRRSKGRIPKLAPFLREMLDHPCAKIRQSAAVALKNISRSKEEVSELIDETITGIWAAFERVKEAQRKDREEDEDDGPDVDDMEQKTNGDFVATPEKKEEKEEGEPEVLGDVEVLAAKEAFEEVCRQAAELADSLIEKEAPGPGEAHRIHDVIIEA